MIGHGARLRDRPALDLPPQELLLSGPAEGLPDQPVRHPALPGAAGSATCASTACTSRRTRPSSSTPASRAASTARDAALVDFNRGGTPLVEIVTEPDLRLGRAGRATSARLLQRDAAPASACRDVNMEEGSLRCDANVSIRPAGTAELGTKTELKNMNSFRFLERGHRRRDRAPGGASCDGGRPGRAGDAPLRPARPAASPRCARRRRRTTTATSRSPTSCRIAPTEEMLERARAALPELPAARARALRARPRAARRHAHGCSPSARAGRLLRAAWPAARPGRAHARQLDDQRAAPRGSATPTPPPRSSSRRRWPRSWRWWGRSRCRRGAAREVLDVLVAEGGDPAERRRGEGPGRVPRAASSSEIVDRAIADNPDAVEKIRAGKARRSARSSAR